MILRPLLNVAKAAVAVALVQRAAKGAEAVVSRVDRGAAKVLRAGSERVKRAAERVRQVKR